MSKKLFYLALVGMLIVLVGNVRAITWDNGALDPNDHLWSNPLNWDLDRLPLSTDNAYVDASPALPRAVLDATLNPGGGVASKVYVGDGNSGQELLITGGAKLTIGVDLNIAYGTGSTGVVTVDGRNTLVNINTGGLKVGRYGTGTVVMNEGTINVVAGLLDIPSLVNKVQGARIGHLQLSGGTITTATFRMRGAGNDAGTPVIGTGTMDVAGGKLIVAGDQTITIQGYIDSGWITAYGGYGTPQMDYNVSNSGKTTLTAVSWLNPSPANGATVSNLTGTVPLSWTNLDPNHPGAPVNVDVWFGSDPNKTANTRLLTGSTLSTVNATGIPVVAFGGPYYWWVDTHNGGPEVIEGSMFTFYVTNDTAPSVEIDTPPMATWIGEPVQLNITVTDDGVSPVTFLWESSDPNAVFSPSNTAEEPTVKMNYSSGRFTVTVTVSDGNPLGGTNSDSVDIYCASSPCEAGRYAGLADVYPTDIVPDCMHNLEDLAALAKNWLIDYTLTAPTPYIP